jgi:mRNA-degrading endonuclease RelE of RelBE toxin-antitoxin system
MNRVIFYPRAEKFLKKLKEKPLKLKFKQAIEKIRENPYIGTAKKGDLSGVFGYDVFYNKTNYEIAYTIDSDGEIVVVIIMIDTRENFYEELKKYFL